MEFIQRLPVVLASLMAIIISFISLGYNVSQREIYTRMGIAIIAFYIIGIYIKNTAIRIQDELEKRAELKRIEEEKLLAAQIAEMNHGKGENSVPSILDLRIDEDLQSQLFEEEFSPLVVSKVVSNKIKN